MDRPADGDLRGPGDRRWAIRPVRAIDEYHACEEIQRLAWSFSGDLDVVPLTQLVAAHKAGGIVLGGFDDDGTMLGFCYGFLGRRSDGKLIHHSHMLAVDPERQSAGLGAALKWAQRDAALAQGIDWMVWTYDPLQALNGYFNFSKLGVFARTYWEDLYGPTTSELHRGTPTDRLLAEWPLRAARVEALSHGEMSAIDVSLATLPAVLLARTEGLPLPHPADVCLPDAERAIIEIPSSIQQIKRADPDLAARWSLATRAAFQGSIERGYHVAACIRETERTFYVIRHGAPDVAS